MSMRSRVVPIEESAESLNTLPCPEVDPNARPGSVPDLRQIRAGHTYVVICSGPDRGTTFALDGYAVVGRHALCDVVLDDITVSRHHAEVERSGGKYTIADLRSLNGTYVNGERVEQAVLTSGDAIQIGRFRLVFVARD